MVSTSGDSVLDYKQIKIKSSTKPIPVTPDHILKLKIKSLPTDFVRLDQDILSPLTGFINMRRWTFGNRSDPGVYTYFLFLGSRTILTGSHLTSQNVYQASIFIHQQKFILLQRLDPTPSYSSASVRRMNYMILDDVEIKENAVIYSIVGWKVSSSS